MLLLFLTDFSIYLKCFGLTHICFSHIFGESHIVTFLSFLSFVYSTSAFLEREKTFRGDKGDRLRSTIFSTEKELKFDQKFINILNIFKNI